MLFEFIIIRCGGGGYGRIVLLFLLKAFWVVSASNASHSHFCDDGDFGWARIVWISY